MVEKRFKFLGYLKNTEHFLRFQLPTICQQISTKTCFARKRKQTFSGIIMHSDDLRVIPLEKFLKVTGNIIWFEQCSHVIDKDKIQIVCII